MKFERRTRNVSFTRPSSHSASSGNRSYRQTPYMFFIKFIIQDNIRFITKQKKNSLQNNNQRNSVANVESAGRAIVTSTGRNQAMITRTITKANDDNNVEITSRLCSRSQPAPKSAGLDILRRRKTTTLCTRHCRHTSR